VLTLPAAAVADALVRLDRPVQLAPASIHRARPGEPVVGPAVPCRHFGSVDVFLEAFERAAPGGVLVIDNEGRQDEACIGDLVVAEAGLAGIAGIVLWGLHRDSAALEGIGLPIWSMGTLPAGPRSSRPRDGDPFDRAGLGEIDVTPQDIVVADDDGVVIVAAADWPEVETAAASILAAETRQAERIAAGTSLRDQLGFREYLDRRRADPSYTLRQHLQAGAGAIET